MLIAEPKAYLVSLGYDASTIYLGREPDLPDDIVSLFSYGGLGPLYTQDSIGPAYNRPRLQVNVRSKSYQTAEALAWQIYRDLGRVTNLVISGRLYLKIRPEQEPFPTGRDAKDRITFTFNSQVETAE